MMGYSFSCDGEQAMSNNCEEGGIVEKDSRKHENIVSHGRWKSVSIIFGQRVYLAAGALMVIAIKKWQSCSKRTWLILVRIESIIILKQRGD